MTGPADQAASQVREGDLLAVRYAPVQVVRIDPAARPADQLVLPFGVVVEFSDATVAEARRFTPPDWPPRRGDLWEDAAESRWLALYRPDGVVLVRDDGLGPIPPAEFLAEHMPVRLLSRADHQLVPASGNGHRR